MNDPTTSISDLDSTKIEECPACGSLNLDYGVDGIDIVCDQCGFTVDDIGNLDYSKVESIMDAQDDSKEADVIDSWSEYATPSNSSEEKIVSGIKLLEELSDRLESEVEIRSTASEIFAKAVKNRVTEGRSYQAVIPAVFYLATREVGELIPLNYVQSHSEGDEDEIEKMVKEIQLELNLEHPGYHPEDYLFHLCLELGLNDDVESRAETVVAEAKDLGIVNGKNPAGVAGAAVYCSAEERISQREVASVAGVSKETLRVRLGDLRDCGITHV